MEKRERRCCWLGPLPQIFSSGSNSVQINGRGILSREIDSVLSGFDLIVSKPRNYYIVKIKDHYIKAHGENDFELLRAEVEKNEPAYIESLMR
ncbi:DUF4422 domain-containing protein [Serratia marcescens]|uniref:DUF4422 domain-containing protein n=1 Tax=Serratia marcescens TaxID=615 RepID=A0A939NQR0_SERMA|nr:DUF4422 domain-containing protein [Serratia marcescens]